MNFLKEIALYFFTLSARSGIKSRAWAGWPYQACAIGCNRSSSGDHPNQAQARGAISYQGG